MYFDAVVTEWTDGMLYPLLHRLLRLGFVTEEWRTPDEGRRRRYYAITDAGRAALAEQRRQWTTVIRALGDVWRTSLWMPATLGGPEMDTTLQSQIDEWRADVSKSPALDARDVDELEAHLRDQVTELDAAGLAADEAFLVAVKRMGDLDTLSREFAREHSGRLWKQLVLSDDEPASASTGRLHALVWAVAAAAAIQVARLAAGFPDDERSWLLRNVGLLVLLFLAGYLAHRRALDICNVCA